MSDWKKLPDIPFVRIVLTMPNVFWALFEMDRGLQYDLPALGARWAWSEYRGQLCIIVIQHTFGSMLNYNPHFHTKVSAGGLDVSDGRWRNALSFDGDAIVKAWRVAFVFLMRGIPLRPSSATHV
jgi:hypothetical protein